MEWASAGVDATGKVQKVVNPSGSDESKGSWKTTGKNTENGVYDVNTASLADGQHVVYIRGMDANGNYGKPMAAKFYIDRTPHVMKQVTIDPDDWKLEDPAALSLFGIEELNNLSSVDYKGNVDAYKKTGPTHQTYTSFSSVLSSVSSG